jgi:hypothetical protein
MTQALYAHMNNKTIKKKKMWKMRYERKVKVAQRRGVLPEPCQSLLTLPRESGVW